MDSALGRHSADARAPAEEESNGEEEDAEGLGRVAMDHVYKDDVAIYTAAPVSSVKQQ